MKFKMLMEDLKNALSILSGVPAKKDYGADESMLQFEKVDDTLIRISAKNDMISANVKVPIMDAEGEWPQVIIDNIGFSIFNVDATMFLGTMRAVAVSKEEIVTFEIKDNNLVVKGKKKRQFKIPYILPTKVIRELYEDEELKAVTAIEFYNHTNKVLPMAADNNPRTEINSVLVDISDKGINFVATDTTKLAVSNVPKESNIARQVLVPKKAIPFLKKAIESSPEASIRVSDVSLGAVSEKIEIYTKLLNGRYPAYKKIIPPSFSFVVSVDKIILLESLKELSYITDEIKISVKKDKMIVSTYHNPGEVRPEAEIEVEGINIEGDFQEKEVVVALRNIYPFIQNVESDKVFFGFNLDTPPFKISGNPEERFLQITMPLSVS